MSKISVKEILNKIREVRSNKDTIIVGIDGCGGSGKSTLAQKISSLGSHIKVVEMDDFYLPSNEHPQDRDKVGGNFDIKRVREQILEPLSRNMDAKYQKYDWENDVLDKEYYTLLKGGIVIVEGVYSINKRLLDFYDYKIWVETTKETRLSRGIERDGEASRELWENEWMPSEENYVNKESPSSYADLVISGDSNNLENDFVIFKNTNM